MIQSFFTGANGLRSQQINIDVIANNVANIGTTGFKQSRTDFKDALYGRMINPVENGEEMNLQHGTGVVPLQTNHIFTEGVAQSTDRSLDFMIAGEGFFTIEGDEDQHYYTRAGNFLLSVEPDGEPSCLVTNDGRYVLDVNGDRVQITGNVSDLMVAPDGRIYYAGEAAGDADTGIQLGIVTFINPVGLESVGGASFRASENSGDPEPAVSYEVTNYMLESSNVDYALEATRLIRAQRAYQLASRCLTTADQMAGLANTIRQ